MDCNVNVALIPAKDSLTAECCPVDWARSCIEIAYRNNCGKSVMCRDGMAQLRLLLADITSGKGQEGDVALIRELCQVVSSTPGCALSAAAAENVLFALRQYPDDWDAHCVRKRCRTLNCLAYTGIYIDPAVCTGCGKCREHAPAGAVLGEEGFIHVIADENAVKTEEFLSCCPQSAIKKYGAVKPRGIPETPVVVGSVPQGGVSRRRRRRD